jgi:signal peptidase I
MAASTASDARPRPRWFDTVRTVTLTLCLALGIRTGVAQAYEVEGPSMEPSLVSGQRLLVLRAAYGLALPGMDRSVATWDVPEVGDVVIVRSPMDGLDLVKRVVGGPGDVVEVHDGVLWRNGQPVEQAVLGRCDPARHEAVDPSCQQVVEQVGERRWTTSRSLSSRYGAHLEPVEVPPGHVFVMGDHRDRSNDSRVFGPVPVERVRGRVLLVD